MPLPTPSALPQDSLALGSGFGLPTVQTFISVVPDYTVESFINLYTSCFLCLMGML